jgi:hypothetical protein
MPDFVAHAKLHREIGCITHGGQMLKVSNFGCSDHGQKAHRLEVVFRLDSVRPRKKHRAGPPSA